MKRHNRKAILYADPGVSIFSILDAVERHGIRRRHLEHAWVGEPDICDHVLVSNPQRGVHWRRGGKKKGRRRVVITIRAEYKEKEKYNESKPDRRI
jgi:hypothetical protein